MISNKYISKIICVMMALAVCGCICLSMFSEQLFADSDGGITMEYETVLFDHDQVMSVNIIMDEALWQEMLNSASSEVYYQCDVEINGKMFYRVGIRPKGNTSLSSIASDPDSDRYSFKLEFDQYVSGQTCFGLDKLILNNNYADATNMKEALIYDMFEYIGADASLYNHASISVNGEYWGVYLALEAVEESFMLRNYGVSYGELYKPDSMNFGGGGGNRGGFSMDNIFSPTSNKSESKSSAFVNTGFIFGDMGGGKGGFSMGGGGANLNYIDDSLDSYSTIWEGEITDTNDSDHKRVVTALKYISEGTDLESYMDISNLLKYMAVHVFSENSDSLSGSMAHNYYLYESNGRLNVIPWDYNLALGGMGGGSDATDTVNAGIDNSWQSTSFFDSLYANEEYHAEYYALMEKLVSEYLLGDGFAQSYSRTRSQIDSLVETDPNALYSYDEYLAAAEALYEVVTLRGESISKQLSGEIPTTDSEQRNSDSLVDASHIDLGVLGSMNMGGGFGGNRGNRDFTDRTHDTDSSDASQNTVHESGIPTINTGFTMGNNQQGGFGGMGDRMPSGEMPSGEMPEGFDPNNLPEGFEDFMGQMPSGMNPSEGEGTEESPESSEGSDNSNGSQSRSDRFPQQGQMPNMSFGTAQSTNTETLVTWGVSIAIMALALILATLYKRKPRRR